MSEADREEDRYTYRRSFSPKTTTMAFPEENKDALAEYIRKVLGAKTEGDSSQKGK